MCRLPSLSAAVATFSPEKHIWRVLLAVHSFPRFLIAVSFRNFLLSSPLKPLSSRYFRFLCNLSCGLNFIEILCLLFLTSVSSTDNHVVHAMCFGFFAVSAQFYMILSTYLYNYSGRRRAFSTDIGERSFEWKSLSCFASLSSIILGSYFFYRHNTYCEPNVYTLFAIAEYCIILSNIAFHSTLYWDFHGKSLVIGQSMGRIPSYQLLPSHVNKNT